MQNFIGFLISLFSLSTVILTIIVVVKRERQAQQGNFIDSPKTIIKSLFTK
jgi:hypothetical protein